MRVGCVGSAGWIVVPRNTDGGAGKTPDTRHPKAAAVCQNVTPLARPVWVFASAMSDTIKYRHPPPLYHTHTYTHTHTHTHTHTRGCARAHTDTDTHTFLSHNNVKRTAKRFTC